MPVAPGFTQFTIEQSIQIYVYAEQHIIPQFGGRYDLTEPPSSSTNGPFNSVRPRQWDEMVEALPFLDANNYNSFKEKNNIRNRLKRHCNTHFHKGHPIHNMKIECKSKITRTLSQIMKCLLKLGVSQELQRHMLGIADPPRVAGGRRPAHVSTDPSSGGALTDKHPQWLHDLASSTSEVGKLWSDVYEWINYLKRNDGIDKFSFILQYLHRNCGLVLDNYAHRAHYQAELRRLRAGSDDTLVKAVYTAIFRQEAGLEVSSSVLYGVNLEKELRGKYDKLLNTDEGKIAKKILDLIFKGQQKIVHLMKHPDWVYVVLEVVKKVRGVGHRQKDYFDDKLRRVDDNETCHFENCPFCGEYSLLLLLLSDLHHLGTAGEAAKKELVDGRDPRDCNEEELQLQKDFMVLICKCAHRIATDLMKTDQQVNGHNKIPDNYAYCPSVTSYRSSFQYGLSVAIDDMKRNLATGCNAEHLEKYLCSHDCHHLVESMKIVVEMPDDGGIVEISLGKLIEISKISSLSGLDNNLTLDELLEGTACEFLITRTMSVLDHDLWHFAWTYREEPELKDLFKTYGFVLDESGNLKYKDGKAESLLEELEIEIEDFAAACDDGHFVLPRSDAFVEAAEQFNENLKRLRRRSSDEAPVVDGGADDGAKLGAESGDEAPVEVGVADGTEVGVADGAKVGAESVVAENGEEEAVSNFEVASDDDDDDETEEEVKDLWWHELTAEDWKWLLESIEKYPVDIPIPDADDDDDASETDEMRVDAESVSSRRMNKEVYSTGGAVIQSSRIPVAQGGLITNYRDYHGKSKKQKTDEDK
jgi:hypothetical protein